MEAITEEGEQVEMSQRSVIVAKKNKERESLHEDVVH
jgi:hypothetical protein